MEHLTGPFQRTKTSASMDFLIPYSSDGVHFAFFSSGAARFGGGDAQIVMSEGGVIARNHAADPMYVWACVSGLDSECAFASFGPWGKQEL